MVQAAINAGEEANGNIRASEIKEICMLFDTAINDPVRCSRSARAGQHPGRKAPWREARTEGLPGLHSGPGFTDVRRCPEERKGTET
jgi:hypothetical protein